MGKCQFKEHLAAAWQMKFCRFLQNQKITYARWWYASSSIRMMICIAKITSRAALLAASQGERRAATSWRTPSCHKHRSIRGELKSKACLSFQFQSMMSRFSLQAQPVRPLFEDGLWKLGSKGWKILCKNQATLLNVVMKKEKPRREDSPSLELLE